MSGEEDDYGEVMMNASAYPGPIEEGLVYGQMIAELRGSAGLRRRMNSTGRSESPSNDNGLSLILVAMLITVLLFGLFLLLGT